MTTTTAAATGDAPVDAAPRSPYQVLIVTGGDLPDLGESTDVTVVDARAYDQPEDLAAHLDAVGIGPADMRARVLLVSGSDPAARDRSLVSYALLCGLAGRRVDLAASLHDPVTPAAEFDRRVRGLPDAGKLPQRPDVVHAGTQHPDLPSTPLDRAPEPVELSQLRAARTVRFTPTTGDPVAAIRQLLFVAGARARGDMDRFPLLAVGDGDDDTIDLERARRVGVELRRAHRDPETVELADYVAPDPRLVRLDEAASAPAADVLAALGSVRSEETGMWRCPRPQRHTNGDANPSTRLVNGRVRCMRCDREPVDPLRLVVDSLDVTPDEAADWILARAPATAEH